MPTLVLEVRCGSAWDTVGAGTASSLEQSGPPARRRCPSEKAEEGAPAGGPRWPTSLSCKRGPDIRRSAPHAVFTLLGQTGVGVSRADCCAFRPALWVAPTPPGYLLSQRHTGGGTGPFPVPEMGSLIPT